jgi:hypothetical protein
MGFLDYLVGKIKCPNCGTSGARKSGGKILCPNSQCANYVGRSSGGDQPASSGFSGSGAGRTSGAQTVSVQYRNFRGELKTFSGDTSSAYRKKNHISIKVAPKRQRIYLSRDRIQNLEEVEKSFPQQVAPGQAWPTPRERQIMNYHKNRRSSSSVFDLLRSKFPHW